MLAALTYSGLSTGPTEAEPIEFDPGLISLLRRLALFVRERLSDAADADAAALISASGGRLTDQIERQIGSRFFYPASPETACRGVRR
jgi:hypothetical protein